MIETVTMEVEKDEAIRIAQNHGTSSLMLEELACHPDRMVRREVANNPNTPEKILKLLWSTWPEAILDNPITCLWELTDLTPLYSRLGEDTLWAWYHYFVRTNQIEKIETYIPEQVRFDFPFKHRSLEYWLCSDPSTRVRSRLAALSSYPEVHARLATDKSHSVRVRLAGNRHINAFCHRIMASDPNIEVMTALAENKYLRRDVNFSGFQILAFFEDENVRIATAANPITPVDVLRRYSIRDECMEVKIAAAKNRSLGRPLHREMQEQLSLAPDARDERNLVLALASNRAADPDFLARLATSKITAYRAAAAASINTPEDLLLALYNDCSEKVRSAFVGLNRCGRYFFDLAMKKGCSRIKRRMAMTAGRTAKQLIALAKDSDTSVRRAVAERLESSSFHHDTDTNRKLVDLLSRDNDTSIRRKMVADPRLSETRLNDMAEDPDARVRFAVARQHNTGDLGMAKLVADKKSAVRRRAALTILDRGWVWGRHNNSLCMTEAPLLRSRLFVVKRLLCGLANDTCPEVRRLLAEHQNTPAQVLRWMIDDSDGKVRESIAGRSRFPRDEMIRLTGQKTNQYFSEGVMTISELVLARLANEKNEYTRAMVARNCRTPIRVLRTLSQDESEFVRTRLAKNPTYIRNK